MSAGEKTVLWIIAGLCVFGVLLIVIGTLGQLGVFR